MSSPEVARVYVGSFWDQPLNNKENADLFEKEEKDLMNDLAVLPRQSAVRKINEVRWNRVETATIAFVFVLLEYPTEWISHRLVPFIVFLCISRLLPLFHTAGQKNSQGQDPCIHH